MLRKLWVLLQRSLTEVPLVRTPGFCQLSSIGSPAQCSFSKRGRQGPAGGQKEDVWTAGLPQHGPHQKGATLPLQAPCSRSLWKIGCSEQRSDSIPKTLHEDTRLSQATQVAKVWRTFMQHHGTKPVGSHLPGPLADEWGYCGRLSSTGTESQNHRMFGGGRDLCGSSSTTPLPKQGHPEQGAQDSVQAGLEYLQRRRLHNLPGQPVPGLRHTQSSLLWKQIPGSRCLECEELSQLCICPLLLVLHSLFACPLISLLRFLHRL